MLLDTVRDIAAEEGRQSQVVLEEALIEEFGASDGVRDLGALESALFRPRTGCYRDVIEEAEAVFESLVQNHPFVDGSSASHSQ